MKLLELFTSLNGSKTYLVSTVLTILGIVILLMGGDSHWALSLLAQGGGLATLRHAVAKLQAHLAGVQSKLNPDSTPAQS